MNRCRDIVLQINQLGKQGKPFVFLIDFSGKNSIIRDFYDKTEELLWKTPGYTGFFHPGKDKQLKRWKTFPVHFEDYRKKFNAVQRHIHCGDTYLLNLTQPAKVETNLTLEEIFHISSAPYKIFLKDVFVSFSPEPFVKGTEGKIFSFPMKGTADASMKKAGEKLLNNSKELAEHNTIVDLIRNDLSRVAQNVTVEKFRYLEHIQTNRQNLWQVSSRISGDLPANYAEKLGDIIFSLLPAGSVTGAPKRKTVEIIEKTEDYDRGFYTGIFGIFDGRNVDSCVLIRFIENQNGQLIYKSGGGITFMSTAREEYEEMLKKIYVPIA